MNADRRKRRRRLVLSVGVVMALILQGCATDRLARCRGGLEPINAPERVDSPRDAR